MAESVIQFLLCVHSFSLGDYGTTRVDGVNQVIITRIGSIIRLIVDKVVDDFLDAGKTADV